MSIFENLQQLHKLDPNILEWHSVFQIEQPFDFHHLFFKIISGALNNVKHEVQKKFFQSSKQKVISFN